MIKRGIIFIFLIVFLICSISLISSTSCTVTTSCPAANTVMKLSSLNNAHGEWYAGTNYNSYFLCCAGLTVCSNTYLCCRQYCLKIIFPNKCSC